MYTLGLSGIPIVNCNNNCSTGSTALYLARNLVKGGLDCVMALGYAPACPFVLSSRVMFVLCCRFEKMQRGNLTQKFADSHASPTERHFAAMYSQGAAKAKLGKDINQFTEDVIASRSRLLCLYKKLMPSTSPLLVLNRSSSCSLARSKNTCRNLAPPWISIFWLQPRIANKQSTTPMPH